MDKEVTSAHCENPPPPSISGDAQQSDRAVAIHVDLIAATNSHLEALQRDQPPRSHLHGILQIQVARNAAGLDIAHRCEAATLKGGQATFRPYPSGNQQASRQQANLLQTSQIAAMRTPVLKDVGHYRETHERGLYAAVKQLIRLENLDAEIMVPLPFRSEAECREYLISWQKGQSWTCPNCGEARRYWLAEPLKFESPCGKQYSAYQGTVFAGSHLPLLTWFNVTAIVICFPLATASQIAKHVSISRVQTIRETMDKIRTALGSDNADQLLAGLNRVVADHLLKVSSSVSTTTTVSPIET